MYYRLISNQFSNQNNINDTQNCIKSILRICKRESAESIACNLDFDSLKHYIYFENSFEEVFNPIQISVTFYLNKILELTERNDIEEVLRIYHKSLLGGHNGINKMIQTINKFFTWKNLTNVFNFPSILISDNATSFTSNVIKELLNLLRIKKIFSTPYRPEANAQIERQNKSLGEFIRAYTNKNGDNWDELLKFAMFAYNNSVHASTGFTPNRLVFGFSINPAKHLTKPKLNYNYDNFAERTRNNIAQALEIAKERLLVRKEQNKMYHDQDINDIEINVGDKILVKNFVKKHKFDSVYNGPFIVTNVEEAYIEYLKDGKNCKIHKNYIKKAVADHTQSIEYMDFYD